MFRNRKMMEGGFCDCDTHVASSGGSGVWRVSEGVLTALSPQGSGGALSPGDAGPRRGQGAHAHGAR